MSFVNFTRHPPELSAAIWMSSNTLLMTGAGAAADAQARHPAPPRGFGEPGRRYKRYMHSQHLHSDDAMPFGWCQRMGWGNCVAVDERECSSGYQSTS